MSLVLVAINAKYIHSSAAARTLAAYAEANAAPPFLVREFTINQQAADIAAALFLLRPRAVFFSCYLWNIGIIAHVAKRLRKVLPHTAIVLGGPEAGYENEALFAFADVIAIGEGERSFVALLRHYEQSAPALEDIPGIQYKQNGEILGTPNAAPMDMNMLSFIYTEEALEALGNRILYYESSRGCPFDCQYCLSSAEHSVRFLPLPRVLDELSFFLRYNVKQVKLIDRTFNCNPSRALAIVRFLMENDNGKTNFHFEVAADLLTDALIECFRMARKGLFQLEIGVQSTNPQTLAAVRRQSDFATLSKVVRAINEAGRTHLHLDLIACLPHEDYESFARSFNDVYALSPQKLQLGFLKLLKGSGLRRDAEKYGIVFDDEAPYEALYTAVLPHEAVLRLKRIEHVLEIFGNSGHFTRTVACMVKLYPSAFAFFEALADAEAKEEMPAAHSRTANYTRLRVFCAAERPDALELVSDLLLFDMLSVDNAPLSGWMQRCDAEQAVSRRFYDDKAAITAVAPHLAQYPSSRLHRRCRLAVFAHNPTTNARERTYILFDYQAQARAGDVVQTHDVTVYMKEA